MTDVRQATKADLSRSTEALVDAFWDDPIMAYLLPPAVRNRHRRLGVMMAMEAVSAVGLGTMWTTADGSANAVWKPPGKWKVAGLEMLRQTPRAVSAFRAGLPRALGALTTIEKNHPTEPHWYLAVLGTAKAAQGKGLGSAVMKPVLDRCDAEGVPAYLESSKEQNVSFYERHGFRVTEVIEFRNGPRAWLMWREPRAA